MKGNSDDGGLEGLGVGGVSTSSSGSSSKGSSSGSSRAPIFVHLKYGTKRFDPGSQCEFCSERADGVIVYQEMDGEYDSPMKVAKAVCEYHKEQVETDKEKNWETEEYHTF